MRCISKSSEFKPFSNYQLVQLMKIQRKGLTWYGIIDSKYYQKWKFHRLPRNHSFLWLDRSRFINSNCAKQIQWPNEKECCLHLQWFHSSHFSFRMCTATKNVSVSWIVINRYFFENDFFIISVLFLLMLIT